MVAIKQCTNDVTELALCHSWLFTWAWQHAHTILFIKWKPPGSIRAHASFRRQKQRTCPSSMSLCMPGLSCSVLLVLLMERLCDLRFCLTWRAAALFPLSTGITPQWRPTTHFLPETEQSHGRVCLILQQRRSRMCPLLDYFCMWCVNNKLNIERGNLKSLLITYWRYLLSLLCVQVDLMLVKYMSWNWNVQKKLL